MIPYYEYIFSLEKIKKYSKDQRQTTLDKFTSDLHNSISRNVNGMTYYAKPTDLLKIEHINSKPFVFVTNSCGRYENSGEFLDIPLSFISEHYNYGNEFINFLVDDNKIYKENNFIISYGEMLANMILMDYHIDGDKDILIDRLIEFFKYRFLKGDYYLNDELTENSNYVLDVLSNDDVYEIGLKGFPLNMFIYKLYQSDDSRYKELLKLRMEISIDRLIRTINSTHFSKFNVNDNCELQFFYNFLSPHFSCEADSYNEIIYKQYTEFYNTILNNINKNNTHEIYYFIKHSYPNSRIIDKNIINRLFIKTRKYLKKQESFDIHKLIRLHLDKGYGRTSRLISEKIYNDEKVLYRRKIIDIFNLNHIRDYEHLLIIKKILKDGDQIMEILKGRNNNDIIKLLYVHRNPLNSINSFFKNIDDIISFNERNIYLGLIMTKENKTKLLNILKEIIVLYSKNMVRLLKHLRFDRKFKVLKKANGEDVGMIIKQQNKPIEENKTKFVFKNKEKIKEYTSLFDLLQYAEDEQTRVAISLSVV